MNEAKTHLSRLVEMVEAGEEVVLARAGRPVARIVPYLARTRERRGGQWKGRVVFLPGYDSADAQALRLDAVLVTRDAVFAAYDVPVLAA